jgi:hypothetical protein
MSKLPPFPKQVQKCRNCEMVLVEKEGFYAELQKEREKVYMLMRDIECLVGTFCEQ